MAIKLMYLCLGVAGASTPAGVIFVLNVDRRIPGLFIDLGLVFHSVGLSILFIPIGLAAGLALAGIVHLGWNRVSRRRRASRTVLWEYSSLDRLISREEQ
jgi:hypothetical protein